MYLVRFHRCSSLRCSHGVSVCILDDSVFVLLVCWLVWPCMHVGSVLVYISLPQLGSASHCLYGSSALFPSLCFHLPLGLDSLFLSLSVWNLFPPHLLCESTMDSSSCVFLPHWLQSLLLSYSLSFCLCICNLSSDSRRPSSSQSVHPEVREQKWEMGCWTAWGQKNKQKTHVTFGVFCEIIMNGVCCFVAVVSCSLAWLSLFWR